MKKKGIIISVVVIAAISIAIYFLLPILSSQDLSKYVPKNAVYVMKMDMGQIAGKLDMKEIQDLKFFRKEVMGGLKSSEKDMMEGVMSNPLKSGIQFRTAPTFFIFDDSKNENEIVGVLMFGIADAKNFKTFLSDLSKEVSVKDPNGDKFYEVSNENTEEFKLYFNDNIAMFLIDLNKKDLSLKKIRDKLMNLENSNSIQTNEAFSSINKQNNDVMAFINKKELKKAIENENNTGLGSSELQALSYLPAAMTLNFNEDAIALKAYQDTDGSLKMVKEKGLEEADLKNVSSKGNPLAFMSVNIDAAKAIEFALDNLGSYEKNEFNTSVEEMAQTFGTDRESLLKIFTGKMSIAFNGMVDQTKIDVFTLEEKTTKAPKVFFWAKLGNKQAANAILQKLVESNQATENEGVYALNEYSYNPTAYLAIKGDDLFFSTDEKGIRGKIKNDNWDALSDANAKSLATSKPIAAFVDLNYKNYEELITSTMSSSEIDIFDRLKKNVLSSFKNISLTGTEKETELVLQLSEQKKNSLQRLFLLLDEAYRISN